MPSDASVVIDTSESPHARFRPVAIGSVRMEDAFWAPRLRQMRDVTLPSQYDILEETGRIDNFRRASGRIQQEFRGIYFNDSDVYKWLEGCAYALAYEPDARIREKADLVIDEIAAAQDDDGYLNSFYVLERAHERWTNLRDRHELYCAGHLFSAAAAYHRATGDRRLLDVATRFADHIARRFGPDRGPGTPGHPQIEMGLIELFRETGNESYRDLCQFFIDQRGHGVIGGSPYHQDHEPFRDLSNVTGHAVRALYLNAGATDLYMETGERALMDALERMWRNMVERRMYVTGGVGARHSGEAFGGDYELPNEVAYAETCGAISNAIWNWRMLVATGEERFADVMELATYNGALSGIGLDGRQYFYVNPLASRGGHVRQRWFDCACCPTNIIRLIGAVPGLLYSVSEADAWIHLYASSTARIELAGTPVRLTQRTEYPWDGDVAISVEPERETRFTLYLRLPGWSEGVRVSVNGAPVQSDGHGGQYLMIRRVWKAGDTVRLSIPMPVTWLVTDPRVETNAGKVAIKRGPIVYCFEHADQEGFDPWCGELDPNAAPSGDFAPALLDGVYRLDFEGAATALDIWRGDLYLSLDRVEETRQAARLKAIPYYAWANRRSGPMAVWMRRR